VSPDPVLLSEARVPLRPLQWQNLPQNRRDRHLLPHAVGSAVFQDQVGFPDQVVYPVHPNSRAHHHQLCPNLLPHFRSTLSVHHLPFERQDQEAYLHRPGSVGYPGQAPLLLHDSLASDLVPVATWLNLVHMVPTGMLSVMPIHQNMHPLRSRKNHWLMTSPS
jgi:hypothetical protein